MDEYVDYDCTCDDEHERENICMYYECEECPYGEIAENNDEEL